MKNVTISIISFLFLLLVISCDTKVDFEGDEYGDTTLRGKVVDKVDSMPLDSVLCTISYSKIMSNSSYMDLSPKTDSTGIFYFEIYCMENYVYDITFSKDGYIFNNYPFAISKAEDNYFYVEMEKDITKVK